MEKVTGVGGIFFKSADPKALAAWYQQHLGIEFGENLYVAFKWEKDGQPDVTGNTALSIFKADTPYFHPGDKSFMINFRVSNLRLLMDELRKAEVPIIGEIEEYDYGKFGWITDPEGNKIELWEPLDDKL